MAKLSLYSTLPVGTFLFVKTCFVGPGVDWITCYCHVSKDLGEEVEVIVTPEEARARRVAEKFVVYKDRIISIES